MKDQLRAGLSTARTRIGLGLAFVRTHRFWVECASITLFGAAAAFSIGYAALGRTAVLEARAADLARAEASLERWRTELRRPEAQELATWRESERTLRGLDGEGARALSVARLVAQRAREVGLSGLRVRLLPPDSVNQFAPVEMGGWAVESAGEGLSVEFDGGMSDVVGLLGALPPQAAVDRVEIFPVDERLHARIILLTRRVVRRE